jgi:hypothetical protein
LEAAGFEGVVLDGAGFVVGGFDTAFKVTAHKHKGSNKRLIFILNLLCDKISRKK